MPPLCPLYVFPQGTIELGTWREGFVIRFLGRNSTCPTAQGERAGPMEASGKGLSAEVTTSYLRLTDAAIRTATLPAGKSQHYLHDTEQPGLRSGCARLAAGHGSTCSPSPG